MRGSAESWLLCLPLNKPLYCKQPPRADLAPIPASQSWTQAQSEGWSLGQPFGPRDPPHSQQVALRGCASGLRPGSAPPAVGGWVARRTRAGWAGHGRPGVLGGLPAPPPSLVLVVLPSSLPVVSGSCSDFSPSPWSHFGLRRAAWCLHGRSPKPEVPALPRDH